MVGEGATLVFKRPKFYLKRTEMGVYPPGTTNRINLMEDSIFQDAYSPSTE